MGYPVKHSLSPVMHNAAIATLDLDYVYLPFAVAPDALADALRGFQAIGLRGFNVTIPHKQSILPYLSNITEAAQAIGAVNTIWAGASGWCGTNTDVIGFLAPLKRLNRSWQDMPALILGNGGAARAVVAACHQLGCPDIWVFGRSADKLATFSQSWQRSLLQPALSVHPWETLNAYLPQAGLVVNTTPLGMAPAADQSPLSRQQIQQLPAGSIVYDLIYTPRPTLFLSLAEAAGLTPIDGLEMLVQQGAAALEQWLQQPVPVAVMRDALLTHLTP